MNEDDPTIRVNIRTATSTRRISLSDEKQFWEEEKKQRELPISVRVEVFEESYSSDDDNYIERYEEEEEYEEEDEEEEDEDANRVVARLFQQYHGSDELQRNSNIRLDVRERESKATDLDKDCSICQNRFKAEESLVTLTECKHIFHYRCISQWGQYKQDCPLCRVAIPVLER